VFVGVGGGVVSDLTGFAAAVYMRGARLCLVSTTLLGMADAVLGGKTGFDLFGIKNLTGAFYPAGLVFAPVESLRTLPRREWKSGMAEVIKTAVLDDEGDMLTRIKELKTAFVRGDLFTDPGDALARLIARSMEVKGRIVEEDPRETGTRRALLNLGHTFGHALEAAAGLGRLTHGEAVAWGMVRACELGQALGITPAPRAAKIRDLLESYGYETRSPHPLMHQMDTADQRSVDQRSSVCPDLAGTGDPHRPFPRAYQRGNRREFSRVPQYGQGGYR
jgi:3-dehydroquinate synthase